MGDHGTMNVPNVPFINGVEYELDEHMIRTGQWRKRQFYAGIKDTRSPRDRKPCEWRSGPVRP